MESKDYKNLLKLSRVVNSTFGTGGPGEARVSSQTVRFSIESENYIKAKYQSLISIGSPHMQEQQMQILAKEGSTMIKSAIDNLTDEWKKQFPDEKVPSFELLLTTSQDNLEFVSYSIYVPVKRAVYRLSCLVKVKFKAD